MEGEVRKLSRDPPVQTVDQEAMIMAARKTFESEALQYTYDRYIGNDPEQIGAYERASADLDVAKLIYNLRTKAGLSQEGLAKKVGTTAEVICRLDDADSKGQSISMLQRIAAVLERRVEIRTVPIKRSRSTE